MCKFNEEQIFKLCLVTSFTSIKMKQDQLQSTYFLHFSQLYMLSPDKENIIDKMINRDTVY